MKITITIDGDKINDSIDLAHEVELKFTKDVDWIDYTNKPKEYNHHSINDFAYGGFGVFDKDDEVTVKIINSKKLKDKLNAYEINKYRIEYNKENNKNLPLLDKYSTETYFYDFIDILIDNGHTVVLE
jgi:hypothetical protein